MSRRNHEETKGLEVSGRMICGERIKEGLNIANHGLKSRTMLCGTVKNASFQ